MTARCVPLAHAPAVLRRSGDAEHILPWVRLHALKDYYGMVALLEEFPERPRDVQSGAVAARAARGVRRRPGPRSISRARSEAGRRAHPRTIGVHPPELLPCAAAADDRPLSAATPNCWCSAGRAAVAADARAAVTRFTHRRSARPAGLAETGVDRPARISTGIARVSALDRERARLLGGRQGAAPDRRARDSECGDPGVSAACGGGPDRDLNVALLPPDSAAAVRHGHLQADPPALGDAPAPVHAPRGCRGTTRTGGRLPRAAVWPPAGRSVALRRVGVGRHDSARRQGRVQMDGHRRTDSGAHAWHQVQARRAAAMSTSRSACTRRTGSSPGIGRWRAGFATMRCRTSSDSSTRAGTPTPPPTTSCRGSRRRAGAARPRPAGKSRRSS